jgi:glycerol-3-phosphate dehydrogenase
MPITDAVCRVLFESLPAAQALSELLARDHKSELPG